jgi:hypothetical protein
VVSLRSTPRNDKGLEISFTRSVLSDLSGSSFQTALTDKHSSKPLSFRTALAVRNLLVPNEKQVPRCLANESFGMTWGGGLGEGTLADFKRNRSQSKRPGL